MGERKGQNKYYPPDFDYKKHKSLAGYHGEHPLRERAKKIGQGILVIRFEMPYNIWCDGCGNHIGMGVRYNAEKSKIGNYYTTPIYKFRMKCHLCPSYIEIKTDPAAHDYVIISGARRKEQRWDPKENEQIVPEDRATHKKIELDAMYRLEHGTEDKAKLKAAIPGVAQIAEHQATKKDDYLLNKLAREKFRDEKKAMSTVSEQNAALLSKSSLNIELVDEHRDDVKLAKLLKYRTVSSFDESQKQKRDEIEGRPLFSPTVDSDSSVNTKQQFDKIRKRLRLPSSHSQAFNVCMSPSTKKTLSPTTFGIVQMRKTEKDLQNSAIHTSKPFTDAKESSVLLEGSRRLEVSQKTPDNLPELDLDVQRDTVAGGSSEVAMDTGSDTNQVDELDSINQATTSGAGSEHGNNALSALGANYDSSNSSGSDYDSAL